MITVISGIRDLGAAGHTLVERAISEAAGARELRFGGARGVDTIALSAAYTAGASRRVVFVPYTVAEQPTEARDVIRRCATRVIELKLPRHKSAYLERNLAMLEGAERLLAFTDGRKSGGTAFTIREARRRVLPFEIVTVPAG